ncbi:MAG: glucose-6-phosphate isomerase [Arenimonas sp.]
MWNEQDWLALAEHARRCRQQSISALIAAEPDRHTAFARRLGPLYCNFARQHLDAGALADMQRRLQESGIQAEVRQLFDGARINRSEDRAVLHTALRSNLGNSPESRAAFAAAQDVLETMGALATRLKGQGITDIVSVGIGGSDLGPRLVLNALSEFGDGGFRVHFLSSADGMYLDRYTAALDPQKTAVLLVSKSFGTQETLINGAVLKAWVGDSERVFAITANGKRAAAFDVPEHNILPIWDWVGGRFSVWSAVAFPVVLGLGMPVFREFLRGAADMDVHFMNAPMTDNLVYWQALMSVWNRNGMGYGTQGIIPYDERLELLPAHLQQVIMESLGKSVTLDGAECAQATSPVLMGASGNPSQHSFFQYLQQGIGTVPLDIIGVVTSGHSQPTNHHFILANLLAQAESLANGQPSEDPQRRYPGNRPSTVMLLDELTPYALGMLLALYEHSVFVQSRIWGINAFDQWGVELGKQIATGLMPFVEGDQTDLSGLDPVTRELLGVMLRS